MPEGDTVHRAARRLHAALAGRELTKSDFRVPRFATLDVSGQVVLEAVARGKHLLIRTGSGFTIHSYLGMDGAWRISPPSGRMPGPGTRYGSCSRNAEHRVTGLRLRLPEVVATRDEGRIVGFSGRICSVRTGISTRGARMQASRRDDLRGAPRPVTRRRLRQRARNELCFLRGYQPARTVGRCDVRATLALGKRLMESNRASAGHVTTGDPRPGRSHYVYGRRGQPCRQCGTPIRRRGERAERVTYLCPHCQPED